MGERPRHRDDDFRDHRRQVLRHCGGAAIPFQVSEAAGPSFALTEVDTLILATPSIRPRVVCKASVGGSPAEPFGERPDEAEDVVACARDKTDRKPVQTRRGPVLIEQSEDLEDSSGRVARNQDRMGAAKRCSYGV